MSRHVEVEFVNRNLALVRGYGTRELLTELTGRPPVREVRSRAWVTTPDRARSLVALLEYRGVKDIAVINAAQVDA